jgi:hypothetical protein
MESKLPSGMTALLIEALGGKEKAEVALRQVIRTKCRDAIGKPGATIGDAYVLAVQEGWLAEFLALTVADLAGADAATPKKRPRLSTSWLCAHLKLHPGMAAREIRETTGARASSLDSLLSRLKKRGVIVSRGARPTMTYYLPADVPKLA